MRQLLLSLNKMLRCVNLLRRLKIPNLRKIATFVDMKRINNNSDLMEIQMRPPGEVAVVAAVDNGADTMKTTEEEVTGAVISTGEVVSNARRAKRAKRARRESPSGVAVAATEAATGVAGSRTSNRKVRLENKVKEFGAAVENAVVVSTPAVLAEE